MTRPPRRIRVLVVDDSVVVRRLVSDVLSADPRLEVVATASNGRIALAKVATLKPDLITLDLEMPVMDGLETLTELRKDHPRLPVVMFSTLTARGAAATLDALERGANDYVTKPALTGSLTASLAAVRDQLVPRIVALCAGRVPRPPSTSEVVLGTRPLPPRRRPTERVDVVAIGVSTGGPEAVSRVLSALPADLRVPVLVVQHMPPVFTRQFAARLDARCALAVSEAASGDQILPGRVMVAPGDHHLRVRRAADTDGQVEVRLDQGVPENYCRPAVDVLFRSVVEVYGAHVLGVVLTGMGQDGTRGAAAIVGAGGSVIVQDAASSVVWGMPGSVVEAGLAAEVLPLEAVAGRILERVAAGREKRPLLAGGSRS